MDAFADLDRDCGRAAGVAPGRSILVDWACDLDTPPCHATALDVAYVYHDRQDQMIYLTGVCGHTVPMCDDFPVTDYTDAIANLFGSLVMDEAERLGIGREQTGEATTVDDDYDSYDPLDNLPAQEEPDCYQCNDQGVVPPDWIGVLLLRKHIGCPSCNPDRITIVYQRSRLWMLRGLLWRILHPRGATTTDDRPF